MKKHLRFLFSLNFLYLLISPVFAVEIPNEKEKIGSAIDLAESSKEKSSAQPAQDEDALAVPEKKSGIETKWEFSAGALGFLLNKPEIKAGSTHFSGVEGVVPLALPVANADFSVDFFKDGIFPLLSFKASTVLSLTSLKESLSLSVPFLFFPLISFGAGAEISTGFFSNSGAYNPEKKEYEENGGFKNFQYKFSGKASLLLPLSKKLIVLAGYEIAYDGLTGVSDSDLWTGGNFNGFSHAASFAALYFLPSKLNLVGLLGATSAKLDDSSLDSRYSGFDGTFRTYLISPFANFSFNEKNSIFLLAPFGNRRSFSVLHEDANEEPLMETTGSEWVWLGIVVKYTHRF
ncbi:MAG: hypothetical protein IKP49_01655 [Treponema sp.]|nr:hypothetical protein [Treponema sp.]